MFNLEQAREIASDIYAKIHNKCDAFIEAHKDDPVNHDVDDLLDDVAYCIMKYSVENDFKEN